MLILCQSAPSRRIPRPREPGKPRDSQPPERRRTQMPYQNAERTGTLRSVAACGDTKRRSAQLNSFAAVTHTSGFFRPEARADHRTSGERVLGSRCCRATCRVRHRPSPCCRRCAACSTSPVTLAPPRRYKAGWSSVSGHGSPSPCASAAGHPSNREMSVLGAPFPPP